MSTSTLKFIIATDSLYAHSLRRGWSTDHLHSDFVGIPTEEVIAARSLTPSKLHSLPPKRKDIPIPSPLPPSAYIERKEPLPLQHSEFQYDEKERVWRTTVFPATRPDARRDALLLRAWMEDSIAQLRHGTSSPADVRGIDEGCWWEAYIFV